MNSISLYLYIQYMVFWLLLTFSIKGIINLEIKFLLLNFWFDSSFTNYYFSRQHDMKAGVNVKISEHLEYSAWVLSPTLYFYGAYFIIL